MMTIQRLSKRLLVQEVNVTSNTCIITNKTGDENKYKLHFDPVEEKIFWPKYQYTLAEDFTIELKFMNFVRSVELEWGKIDVDIHTGKVLLTIYKGYAWDGSSGRIWQGKKIERADWMPIITEDSDYFSETLTASLIHDFLYQFMEKLSQYHFPKELKYFRRFADLEFARLLKDVHFSLRKIYYIAVRIFGGLFYKLGLSGNE